MSAASSFYCRMTITTRAYTGRFAPTPSGPLHLGSVIAALASYLDARSHGGKWLLRFDDLDTPRVVAGAAEKIQYSLEQLAMEWDDKVTYQSCRISYYEEALHTLSQADLTYRCYCPRRITRGIPYPGTCREIPAPPPQTSQKQYSLRIRTGPEPVRFIDRVQLMQEQDISHDSGDFIVRRADNIFAYHLATAIDDSLQGITDVIRGADLLDSTAKQLYLQSLLQLRSPTYGHVPVLTDIQGVKISKRDRAMDVLMQDSPGRILFAALSFLGQAPAPELATAAPSEIISWARQHWDLSRVAPVRSTTLAVGLINGT